MEDHMARTEQPHEKVIETWEIQTEGTVWVWIYDRREDRYVKQRVGGRQGGSKRLHISTDDRRYNQEQIVDEMKGSDPFLNGALRLVSADKPEDLDTTYHLTLQDLQSLLEVRDLDLFEEEVRGITSELTLRRLLEVAETHGTVGQLNYIREVVTERYKVGGTQRTVQEMIEAGEKLSGTQLS
jgi:hypothetical protein